jgi:hypothetical protein
MSDFGEFIEVPLKDQWPNEERNFTPWLAENIHILSTTIGIELEVVGLEEGVGRFSADILCKNKTTGQLVLIENQYGETNHDHLGQIITYSAGLKTATIIWIANIFSQEYKDAFDWLNETTKSDINFLGIEFKLLRIGDSLPAPFLLIVSKPKDWFGYIKDIIKSKEMTQVQKLQLEFWNGFKDYLRKNNSSIHSTKPFFNYMIHSPFGKSGFNLNSVFSTFNSESNSFDKGEVRVEFVISTENSKEIFDLMLKQKEKIELEFGADLKWSAKPEAKNRIIYISKTIDCNETERWEEYFAWLKDNLEKFKQVFSPRIAKL